MPRGEVEGLLGPPADARPQRGWVHDGVFSVRLGRPDLPPHPDEREYDYAGWQRIAWFQTYSAVVIFDGDRVACRYSSTYPSGLWARWRDRIRSLF
jgi:hypothetical protein